MRVADINAKVRIKPKQKQQICPKKKHRTNEMKPNTQIKTM